MKKTAITVVIVIAVVLGVIFMAGGKNTVNESFAGPERSLTDVLWIGPTGADMSGQHVEAEEIARADSAMISFFRSHDELEIVRNPFPNSGPPDNDNIIDFIKTEGADHGLLLDVYRDSTGHHYRLHVWPGLSGNVTLYSRDSADSTLADLFEYALLEIRHTAIGGIVKAVGDSTATIDLSAWTGNAVPDNVLYWRPVSALDPSLSSWPILDVETGRIRPFGFNIEIECPADWEIYTRNSGTRIADNSPEFTFTVGRPQPGDMARENR